MMTNNDLVILINKNNFKKLSNYFININNSNDDKGDAKDENFKKLMKENGNNNGKLQNFCHHKAMD